MKRLLVLVGTACVITSLDLIDISGQAARTSAKTAAKAWSPHRLADGQPDIQGVWTNYDNTPFQTPSPEDAAALAALREWFPPGDQTGPGSVWGADGPGEASRNSRR